MYLPCRVIMVIKKKKKYTCGEPSTEVDSHNRHTAMAGPWEMKGGRSGSKLCAL